MGFPSNNRVYFGEYDHGDSWPFNGQNGLLAHAFYPDPAYAGYQLKK